MLSLLLLAASAAPDNGGPVVALVMQGSGKKGSYVPASYVKWLESAGARAVPLLPDDPPEVLDAKLASINGVLIPGGDSDVSPGTPLRRLAERVVRESLDAWRERRETFPVWGTRPLRWSWRRPSGCPLFLWIPTFIAWLGDGD